MNNTSRRVLNALIVHNSQSHRAVNTGCTRQQNVTSPSTAPDVNSAKQAKPYSDIPKVPGLPYFGSWLMYRLHKEKQLTHHEELIAMYKKYGKIFRETFAGAEAVHLFDPQYSQEVYMHEGKVPHIPPLLSTTQAYRKLRHMSSGLGNTNGEEWYRMRSATNPIMMKPAATVLFLPAVNVAADDFVAKVKVVRDPTTGAVPDFYREMQKWNIECLTYFEKRLGCLGNSPLIDIDRMLQANDEIFSLSVKLQFGLPWYQYFATPTWRKFVKAEDYFFGHSQKLVDEATAEIKRLSADGQMTEGKYRFMAYLLSREDLSYKEVSVTAMSAFADGLSTTVRTLAGVMYCLARNPDKQAKLAAEIDRIAPDKTAPITGKQIESASYLKACVKEGFRFFPVGSTVSRIVTNDLVIGGYNIPAGTNVELHSNLLLQDPDYIENPQKFIPERWVRGSAESVHPYLLTPFSFGPRTCAGRRFAEQEMYVVIMKFLQNYRMEWPHQEEMKQIYSVTLAPSMPAKIHFHLRKMQA